MSTIEYDYNRKGYLRISARNCFGIKFMVKTSPLAINPTLT
jgi:hypothetical protein